MVRRMRFSKMYRFLLVGLPTCVLLMAGSASAAGGLFDFLKYFFGGDNPTHTSDCLRTGGCHTGGDPAIPEPTSALVFATGLLVISHRVARRRREAAAK